MWHFLQLNLICQVSGHLSKKIYYFAAYRSHLMYVRISIPL